METKPDAKLESAANSTGSAQLDEYLKQAVKMDAREIILCQGDPATFVDGNEKHVILNEKKLLPDDVLQICFHCLSPSQRDSFKAKNIVRTTYSAPGLGQYAMLIFVSAGRIVIHVKRIFSHAIPLSKYPPVIKSLLDSVSQGLVICYGDGSSNVLTNSILNYYNSDFEYKIVILANGLDFMHRSKKSKVFFLEQWSGFGQFRSILPILNVLNPDVIVADGIVDNESAQNILFSLAQSQLVILNMRAVNAAAALNSLLHLFPPYQHYSVRKTIADVLHAMIGQKMVMTQKGIKRPVYEVLVNTREIRNIINEYDDIKNITPVMEKNSGEGMMSFDQDIEGLISEGEICLREGLRKSTDKERFMREHYFSL